MRKTLLATVALLCLLAMPAFADTVSRSWTVGPHTYVLTITYTDSNSNGRIDTLAELRSITSVQLAKI